MKGYQVLEHIGDAKIKVFGKTKEELFLNAMLGMAALLKPKFKTKKPKVRYIKIQSSDINALLVDFLSEVNYLRQINMEIYDNVKFIEFSDTYLEAEFSGYEVEEFGDDIKAATFHELNIKKNKDGLWETAIVFDI